MMEAFKQEWLVLRNIMGRYRSLCKQILSGDESFFERAW